MTEDEWLSCSDPMPMLLFVRGRGTSDRKLRLFAVACCRRVWSALVDERSRNAVAVAERYADGAAVREEVLVALSQARRAKGYARQVSGLRHQTPMLAATLCLSLDSDHRFIIHAAGNAACLTEEKNGPDSGEQRMQSRLALDLFGNPFRPVTFAPEWRTSTVVSLAQQMYDEREFGPMPILADALQDAGCENDDILNHCRGPGPHVRGCWVVDLVLGKE